MSSTDCLQISGLIFLMLSTGIIKCFSVNDLSEQLIKACSKLDTQELKITSLCASTITHLNTSRQLLTVAYEKKGFLKMFEIDSKN